MKDLLILDTDLYPKSEIDEEKDNIEVLLSKGKYNRLNFVLGNLSNEHIIVIPKSIEFQDKKRDDIFDNTFFLDESNYSAHKNILGKTQRIEEESFTIRKRSKKFISANIWGEPKLIDELTKGKFADAEKRCLRFKFLVKSKNSEFELWSLRMPLSRAVDGYVDNTQEKTKYNDIGTFTHFQKLNEHVIGEKILADKSNKVFINLRYFIQDKKINMKLDYEIEIDEDRTDNTFLFKSQGNHINYIKFTQKNAKKEKTIEDLIMR